MKEIPVYEKKPSRVALRDDKIFRLEFYDVEAKEEEIMDIRKEFYWNLNQILRMYIEEKISWEEYSKAAQLALDEYIKRIKEWFSENGSTKAGS